MFTKEQLEALSEAGKKIREKAEKDAIQGALNAEANTKIKDLLGKAYNEGFLTEVICAALDDVRKYTWESNLRAITWAYQNCKWISDRNKAKEYYDRLKSENKANDKD